MTPSHRPRYRPGFIAFLLATTASALAAPVAPFECRWADVPPVIDGRGDETIWTRAEVADRFLQAWAPGAPVAKEQTRVRLLWDREWLYFFAEMDDSDISAEQTEHDAPLWENDVIEIFLRPSPDHAGYYEFEVNPAAAMVDAFFPNAESRRDREQLRRGEFHVEARVTLRGTLNAAGDRDSGWSVEGRIPWSDLQSTGGRPAPGETWSVNLARINGPRGAQELSSVAPLTQPSFHRTEEYLPLRFTGPEALPRPLWENTRLIGSPDGPEGFRTTRAWPKLVSRQLVGVHPTPDGESIWVIEQDGYRGGKMKIRRMSTRGDGDDVAPLLEPDDEVYNLAFHPRYSENGFVYLGANGPASTRPRTSHVLRYTVRDGRPDPASRTVIIAWPSDGHNGAAIAFARDGLLFVTSGDGTSHSDVDNVGQDLRSLRSKIMRLDVDRPSGDKLYSVPADNPFVSDSRFAPETWAYGLRNPWRLTYDAASGQLWSGENGQDQWEYARLVQRGANYGWSVYEGGHVFAKNRPLGPHPVTLPTVEFSHAEFRSLTGGIVYRGRLFPELVGAYVFGDFGTGRVWAAKHDGARLEWMRELIDTPFSLTHVTAGPDGELLLVDYGIEARGAAAASGAIHRLERALPPAGPLPEFPRRLSETGLFSDLSKLTPLPGVTRYEINLPGWHDGATSVHHLALPGAAMVQVRPSKSWQLPDGSVLAQTLTLEGKRVETRLLVKQQNDFAGYSYVWNADETDAVLAPKTGMDREFAGRPWRVPSRAECMMCHSREANFSLTLHESQLNRGEQLARWEKLGLLHIEPGFDRGRRPADRSGGRFGRPTPDQRAAVASSLFPRDPSLLRKHFSPQSADASLELRARSYLAVNCAHCHTLNGGGNSVMNFDSLVPTDRMRAIDERPQHGEFDLREAKIIAAGDAGRSVLIPRVALRGPGQMPPVGSRVPDTEGVRLLAEWIASLAK